MIGKKANLKLVESEKQVKNASGDDFFFSLFKVYYQKITASNMAKWKILPRGHSKNLCIFDMISQDGQIKQYSDEFTGGFKQITVFHNQVFYNTTAYGQLKVLI